MLNGYVQRGFHRRTYELLRGHALPEDVLSKQVQLVILCVIVWLVPILIALIWLLQYYTHHPDLGDLVREAETLTVHLPTQGFLITMQNSTGWKAAEHLKQAFGITDMHVVMGHVGNESALSLYNRYLMRHGRTDTLQIGNLGMLGCLESHRAVWTRIQEHSYVFEEDAVPVKHALSIVKTLLNDSAHRHWDVIHLDVPGGFFSGSLFTPDRAQYTNVGHITQTCRDCIAYSTRAYILTKAAAQILLKQYEPAVVQVDAYMSLLNAFHPNFRQVWTRVQAVDEAPHTSYVQNYYEPVEIMHAILTSVIPQH